MKTRLSLMLSLGTLGALLLGVVILSTEFSSAGPGTQTQQDPLPTRVPSARPDERGALPVVQARQQLSLNAGLAAVLEAAEDGDVAELISMAQPGKEPYCASWKYLPPECKSKDEEIDSVYFDSGEVVQRATESVRDWLVTFYQGGGGQLEFASRDKREPEGDGGRYFLFFRIDSAIKFDGEFLADGLGLVVVPGESHPIQSFIFFRPDDNGLKWIQWGPSDFDEAGHHQLITPVSVSNWPDLFHAPSR